MYECDLKIFKKNTKYIALRKGQPWGLPFRGNEPCNPRARQFRRAPPSEKTFSINFYRFLDFRITFISIGVKSFTIAFKASRSDTTFSKPWTLCKRDQTAFFYHSPPRYRFSHRAIIVKFGIFKFGIAFGNLRIYGIALQWKDKIY